MGKILNFLGLIKLTEHLQILIKKEDELNKEINSLKRNLKEANGQYLSVLNDLSDALEEIKNLKEDLDTKRESLETIMMRNKELQKTIADLKSDRYLRKPLAPDKTKSKNVHECVQRPLMIHK